MLVTGFQLREAIRRWHDRRDIYSKNFAQSLFRFEGDEKSLPTEMADQFTEADRAVAELEAAQQEYNQLVTVELPDGKCSLSVAVKRLGGAGRLIQMWRKAATDDGLDKWDRRELKRNKEDVYAERAVSVETAMARSTDAAMYASKLREAIALGNATRLNLNVRQSLFIS